MVTTFAFGSYLPESSQVHALKAQVKIVLACAFSVSAFFVETWLGICALCVAVAFCYRVAKIPLRHSLKGLAPLVFIFIFTVLVHAFSFGLGPSWQAPTGQPGSIGALQQFVIAGDFGLTLDGTLVGLFLALRLALVVGGCSLLTFSTSLEELVDGLRALLGPLERLGVPVDDVTMVISLALRFIPTTIEQAQSIKRAQMARGASFEDGSLFTRLKAWGPVIIPLFVSLFRKADKLGTALEARCYGVAKRRCAVARAWQAKDVAVLVAGLALLVALCVAF